MIIQEEKVEIVEDEKPKALQKAAPNNIQKREEKPNDIQELNTENKSNKKGSIYYFLIFIAALLLVLLVIFGAFALYNISHNNVIANGIYVYGVDLSGKTKGEALEAVSKKFDSIQNKDIKLISDKYETAINPTEINLKYDINSAINYAFSIGKTGNLFKDNFEMFNTMVNGTNITPTYSLDDDSLISTLDKFSKELPNAVVESSYYIEKSNLIITKGKAGYVIDSKKTSDEIHSKLKDLSYLSQTIKLSLIKRDPKPINVDEIYNEVHKEAKDAYYTTNPYAVYPSENGIDFKISLQEAKEKVAKSQSDKEISIALKTIYPKVTTNMLGRKAFPDLLAQFSTNYVNNPARTTNLRLAANKINGTVLLPGETFSYNKTVGERTIAAGYKNAAIYQNGEVVDGLGGGICQISTTLFNAVLFANLNIVELHNHQFVPSYVGAGRDATVVYGAKDFQFKNSRKHAIKIECSVSGGVARFKIYGVKEDTEYDVKVNASIISSTATYIRSSTYRTLYLKGKKVSSERIYSCTYKKH